MPKDTSYNNNKEIKMSCVMCLKRSLKLAFAEKCFEVVTRRHLCREKKNYVCRINSVHVQYIIIYIQEVFYYQEGIVHYIIWLEKDLSWYLHTFQKDFCKKGEIYLCSNVQCATTIIKLKREIRRNYELERRRWFQLVEI